MWMIGWHWWILFICDFVSCLVRQTITWLSLDYYSTLKTSRKGLLPYSNPTNAWLEVIKGTTLTGLQHNFYMTYTWWMLPRYSEYTWLLVDSKMTAVVEHSSKSRNLVNLSQVWHSPDYYNTTARLFIFTERHTPLNLWSKWYSSPAILGAPAK